MKTLLLRTSIIATLPFLMVGCERHPIQSHKPMYTVGCQNNPYLMKYGCSVDRIQTAAENGDPDAQYGLGYMYYYGIDTVRDQQTAQLWIKRAADQGQPLAQKAQALINNGSKFNDLHQAAAGKESSRSSSTEGAGDDTPTPNQTIVKQPDADVSKMNSGVPAEPITNHLPAYHSAPSTKSSGGDAPIAAAKPQPTQKRDITAMNQTDSRLANGSKPIVAMGASQDKSMVNRALANQNQDKPLSNAVLANQDQSISNAVLAKQDKSAPNVVLAKASDHANAESSQSQSGKIIATQGPDNSIVLTDGAAQPLAAEKTPPVQVASNDQSDFTMQLMASDKMGDLKAFAASHQLKSHVRYYQTAMNGKPWYMLTYGRYSTEKQAVTALGQLPSDLKSYHPWVKSMATIENEVRLNKVIA
jgi:hypothetical protein